MIELQFDSFPVVRSFFEGKKQHIPALSVINGDFPGRVFVDHEENPIVVIVWATGRGMYPLWETTHNNLPSHKLALKLGFEPIDHYPVYTFVM